MKVEIAIRQFLHHTPKPLIVILGPTGAGKTALSLPLAKQFQGEIVNADSRQIYRGMDIGTNKITKKEMGNIPHHLFSFKNPDEVYTVAEYKEDAEKVINNILKRKKIPFLVGGTGLYINVVTMNYAIPKIQPDVHLRTALEKEAMEKGVDFLYKKLLKLDPTEAKKHHPHQLRYIIRALEIALGGKKKSESAIRRTPLFNIFYIGVDVPRKTLYERINQRVEKMFHEGIVEEVRKLQRKGYDEKSHAMSGIGYKEILEYLSGHLSLEQTTERIKKNTRHFAKRQMTWFKRIEGVRWITV